MRLARTCLAIAASFAIAVPAFADPDVGDPWTSADVARARELFARAESAEATGRWAEALEQLEQVAAIKRTAAVVYHQGVCQERLGRLADAMASFERSVVLARAQPNPAILRLAAAKIATNLGRVPRAAITVEPAVPDTIVLLDGTALPEHVRELRLDPGRVHTIEVRVPGHLPFFHNVSLPEGGYATVHARPEPIERDAPSAQRASHRPPLGTWIAAGAALGLGASALTTFFYSTAVRAGSADQCDMEVARCVTDEATADQNEARTLQVVSLGLAITATAALGLGVMLWVSDAQSDGPTSRVPSTSRRNVSLEARPGGATLDVRF